MGSEQENAQLQNNTKNASVLQIDLVENTMLELHEAKLTAIVSLGFGAVVVGLLPACFVKQGRQQWPLFLSSLLCFGGGVLLATSLIHILPELREASPELSPHAEILFCTGFFLLYMIDEIVHFFYGETDEIAIFSSKNHGHSHQGHTRRHSTSSKYTYGSTERDPLVYPRQFPYNPQYKSRSEGELFGVEATAPSQLCHVGHQEPCHSTPTANMGLLFALSIHALLEGLVIGLEKSSSKVILLLGAVASHKLVVGFCLGTELATNNYISFCKHFVGILVFSLGSVGGIAVGMLISNTPEGFTNYAIPILQGIAGGTLLYVTLSEILPRERARWHQQHNQKFSGLSQFTAFVIGFISMTLMTKYLDYDS